MAMEFFECDTHVNIIVGENAETAVCEGCGITKEAAIKAGKPSPCLFDIQLRDKHLTLCHSCTSVVWNLTTQALRHHERVSCKSMEGVSAPVRHSVAG